jgi:hypothetical protein
MNTEQIKLKRQEIVNRFGDWTAHNIHLRDDIYTYDQSDPKFKDQLVGHGNHLRRIVQIVADITNQPLGNLRVLDLACLEGLYGIEFARHGSEVIGIEGREANIEKARFAKDVIGLDGITFAQDDVRHLSVEKYGRFDVVLCLGILYHLDNPDIFGFVESLSEVCRRVAIIDTHVGISPNKSHIYKGQEYHGWTFTEHPPEATEEARLQNLWASLDNEKSFWFTRPSLFNLLSQAGFTSVYTCQNPAVPGQWTDRDTLVAVKGNRQELFSTPVMNGLPDELWTEESRAGLHPSQQIQPNDKPRRILSKVRRIAGRILR